MANDVPPINFQIAPDQAQVLYAGNLADDDFLWIARCSTDEFVRLIQSPVEWVAALAALPGWRYYGKDEPAPPAVLLRDFAMVVREGSKPDPDGWVLVQGISETNELTVNVSRDAALRAAAGAVGVPADDPFATFWEEVSADPENPPTYKKPYAVTIVRSLGRFYGHFEIFSAIERPTIGAQRTAAYLLASTVDRDGYAKMLSGLDQTTLYADGGEVTAGQRIEILPAAPGTAVVYASVDASATDAATGDSVSGCGTNDGETNPPPPPAPQPAPDPTAGTTGTTIVKFYKATTP